VALPANTAVQYKYIKKEGSTVIWESDPNRTRTTAATSPCTATWTDTWR
jgi:alpha-amylase